jgi:hypothetical protein
MPNNPYVVYIGMCDRGEIIHLQEVIHLYMVFQRNRMPLMQRQCVDGWPHNCFLFMASLKLRIPLNVW